MASDVDNYWWEADNLTTLCTYDCFKAVDYVGSSHSRVLTQLTRASGTAMSPIGVQARK